MEELSRRGLVLIWLGVLIFSVFNFIIITVVLVFGKPTFDNFLFLMLQIAILISLFIEMKKYKIEMKTYNKESNDN